MENPRGITLIELVMTLAVLGILFGVAGVSLNKLQQSLARNSSDREIIHILSSAARKARHGSQSAGWGVYIPYDLVTRTTTSITVFSGPSYATRNPTYDTVYTTNKSIKFTAVDFSGPGATETSAQEIYFAPLTGETNDYGSISLEWYGASRVITIDPDGFIVRQ